ncbi:hypothetical protein [Acinetobacter bereziniae]|uniref:hypothetical protein n=1 Tax=Acinetobacter bereziniae TaxID=106648 RepID=UPI001116572F|nr:hypothetical protein [Acinetobacter bereziniae]MBJ8442779.1 hypothetical protein [Acinetobacter bereziniae]TNL46784.1 hypothetical protein EYB59_16320 [Acinetobacter bereziniae]TNL57096.1 hypothetical protein EYY58_14060 [Acinetobacter bereziniae]
MNKKIIFVTALFLSSITYAGENVLNRKILDIGCHMTDGTCYVTLTGEPFGAYENCPSKTTNTFRFNSSSIHGRRAYASFYGAFLSKKIVDVYIDGCYETGSPTITYYHVK